MAKKIWDEKINRGTDWGGDSSTEGLPVSGARVQEFIKEEFDNKAGVFYYDTTNNRYLVFANTDTRDLYLEDPTRVDLVLGTFDAPFNYSAEIHLETPSYNSILTGTKNNYIDFTFDTKNKQGASVGEDVICTYTFIKGANKKIKTIKYRYGERVHFNVDEYISDGTNNINISIVGANTFAATTSSVTYLVVALSLINNYNVAIPLYKEENKVNTIAIPYQLSGTGTKILEWYLNGKLLPFNKVEDEVVETTTSRVKYINAQELSQGKHNIQFRAYVTINGEKFYTNTAFSDVLISERKKGQPIIGITNERPFDKGIADLESPLFVYGASQYVPYTLELGLLNPTINQEIPFTIKVGDKPEESLVATNGQKVSYSIVPITSGDISVVIKAGHNIYNFILVVTKSNTDLQILDYGLQLDLTAIGKTNNSSQKDVWEYKDFKTTFNNFKWSESSGWNNNSLLFREGASISINIQALTQQSTVTGRTLEFELSTSNVLKDDAIVCDLRTGESGLLITASAASVTSVSGKKVITKFKSGENIRVAFVINPSVGTTNKGLAFIYVNGICTGAVNYANTDKFLSKETFTMGGDKDVNITLKSLRFYDIALTHEQVLNNYILYRESVTDLLNIYDRNNIFDSSGVNFSVDLLSRQAPVLIVTGDIPVLENTSNKKETIYVDLEYINVQDPTKSFTTKGTRMRPQGTSSMGYPKKNFRIYTKYGEMFDYQGKQLEKGLYSFKDNAQPVNVWCFKADYAESSGTHNTGVARLWNDVMYNAQIDGKPLLRTEAQKVAREQGYPYDVRTTVDGFPFHIFYKLTPGSDLIYIGKYNFNNDKSTESVFGFTDIPEFDNSGVQCLEILNNGNAHALFQTAEDLDDKWEEAYEFRYPEERTDISDLKDLTKWLVSTRHSEDVIYGNSIRIQAELFPESNGVYPDNKENRILKFSKEKWDYFDIPKLAAYYIYLMRFGAVDQVVKNAMLTTEGTQGKGTKAKWFFINYDNDTVIGLRNDGPLIYDYSITRQTLDTSFSAKVYAYAGHESTLWNNLEEDTEFINIVSKVDNALYLAGLSYRNVSKMFNIDQASKWCERVYNQDSQYKYIGPYTNDGINNLYMLQGSRTSHRQWWLSNRFALLDSKYVSGAYKSNSIEFKVANAPIGLPFTVTANKAFDYGYGLNNIPIETNISLDLGQSHTFNTKQVINVGDPVRVYSAPTLKGLDISSFIEYLSVINIERVNNDDTGTYFEDLILGVDTTVSTKRNASLTAISGLDKATRLLNLNIAGFKSITTLDLSKQKYLETLKAKESGLTSVELPIGAPIKVLELSSFMQSLVFKDLTSLAYNNVILSDVTNVHTIDIQGCPLLASAYLDLINQWYTTKVTPHSESSLILDNVDWKTTVDALLEIGQLKIEGGNLRLKGKAEVGDLTQEQIDALYLIYGENCFNSENEFYIVAPPALFLIGPTELLSESEIQYSAIAVGYGSGTYRFVKNKGDNFSITEDGLLKTSTVYSLTPIVIRVWFTEDNTGVTFNKDFNFTIHPRVQPSKITIDGSSLVSEELSKYTYKLEPSNTSAVYKVEWELKGEAVTQGYLKLETVDDKYCIVRKLKTNTGEPIKATLEVVCKTTRLTIYDSMELITVMPGVLITAISHPSIMGALYSRGIISSPSILTKVEAEGIKELPDNIFVRCGDKSFLEFQYFTGLTEIPSYAFMYTSMKVALPLTIKKLKKNALSIAYGHFVNLHEVLSNIEELGEQCLNGVALENPNIDFKKLTKLNRLCFYESKFKSIKINISNLYYLIQGFNNVPLLESIILYKETPSTKTYNIKSGTFTELPLLKELVLTDYIGEMEHNAFFKIGVKEIVIPRYMTVVSLGVFEPNISDPLSMKFKNNENLDTVITVDDTGVVLYKNKTECLGSLSRAVLPEVVIKKETIEIGPNAFENSKGRIAKINLPEALQYIGTSAFDNSSLKGDIILSNSIKTLGSNCFSKTDITSLDIKNANMFAYRNYDSFIRECNNLEILKIGRNAFLNSDFDALYKDLPKLKTVIIEEGNPTMKLSQDGKSIIKNTVCINIIPVIEGTVTIDEGVTVVKTIQDNIEFKGVHTVIIPSTIQSLSTNSMGNFTNLKSLIIKKESAPSVSSEGDTFEGRNRINYTGKNTAAQNSNKLYIPTTGQGYDSRGWTLFLLNPDKGNFTISQTL